MLIDTNVKYFDNKLAQIKKQYRAYLKTIESTKDSEEQVQKYKKKDNADRIQYEE